MHIEHIMPQTLSAEWISDLSDWGVDEPAQKHQSYLHTIGNLTLLEAVPSTSIGNARFSKKRDECYSTESLLITSELASQSIWTDREMAARADRLLRLSCTLFTGPLSGEELVQNSLRFGLHGVESVESDEEAPDDDET